MKLAHANEDRFVAATVELFEYCRRNDWAGYDPYDVLNSGLFKRMPILDSWFPRLALTQILKRSPVNIRPLLQIPKTQNPKAMGLFLKAVLTLSKLRIVNGEGLPGRLVDRIKDLRSGDTPYWCWGYSFPWQGYRGLVPRGEPNLVCTAFVADALMDLYDWHGRSSDNPHLGTGISPGVLFEIATSSADYFIKELYWDDGGDRASFGYPLPSVRTPIHNANFLAAALLARMYKHTGEKKFLEPALKTARYSVTKQNDDGSWYYGENAKQRWIDNFHTGYNLCALRAIGRRVGTDEFEAPLRKGFLFYRNHFFRKDGAPAYFHDKVYPIDIHSVAQSVVTLVTLKDLDGGNLALARSVIDWSLKYMRDSDGYFYYQIKSMYKNRIPYMRWSQAWMLLALATYLDEDSHEH